MRENLRCSVIAPPPDTTGFLKELEERERRKPFCEKGWRVLALVLSTDTAVFSLRLMLSWSSPVSQ